MIFELLGYFGICGINYHLKSFKGRHSPNKYGVYYDNNGDERLASNLKKVYKSEDNNGDKVYKYVNNGQIAINIDEIDSEERRKKAIKNKKRFYLRQSDNGNRTELFGDKNIRGDRYCLSSQSKIINYDSVYVIRRLEYRFDHKTYYGTFFMDMNGKLFSPTDNTIANDKKQLIKDGKDLSYMYEYINLYKSIINEWNSTMKKNIIEREGLYVLGECNKKDLKNYTNKILRRR